MGNKKAQLAVETLLIYGIAILVVMLAIGALIGFGVLDMGNLLPDQCQMGDLTCENYQVSAASGVQVELRNNLGKNIKMINLKITGEGDNEGFWQNCNVTYDTPILQGDLTNPAIIMPLCTVSVPQGKKIQGIIVATVGLSGSSINRTIKGKIRATVS